MIVLPRNPGIANVAKVSVLHNSCSLKNWSSPRTVTPRPSSHLTSAIPVFP